MNAEVSLTVKNGKIEYKGLTNTENKSFENSLALKLPDDWKLEAKHSIEISKRPSNNGSTGNLIVIKITNLNTKDSYELTVNQSLVGLKTIQNVGDILKVLGEAEFSVATKFNWENSTLENGIELNIAKIELPGGVSLGLDAETNSIFKIGIKKPQSVVSRVKLNVDLHGKFNISSGFEKNNESDNISLGVKYQNGKKTEISANTKYDYKNDQVNIGLNVAVKEWKIMATAKLDLKNLNESTVEGSVRLNNGKWYFGIQFEAGPNETSLQGTIGIASGFSGETYVELQEIDIWTTKEGKNIAY